MKLRPRRNVEEYKKNREKENSVNLVDNLFDHFINTKGSTWSHLLGKWGPISELSLSADAMWDLNEQQATKTSVADLDSYNYAGTGSPTIMRETILDTDLTY
jgi:hypothetical protein